MAYLLHIDTALDKASVCLSNNESVLQIRHSYQQKEHASFLHSAIVNMLEEEKLPAAQLSAIAVSSGPGSYTGLRIAMATAKGLCYALNAPLITISTFEIMCAEALTQFKTVNKLITKDRLLCPMIDARRQEVYMALLNQELEYVEPAASVILSTNTLIGQLNAFKISFFGNGAIKFKPLCTHKNAEFLNIDYDAASMVKLSYQRFSANSFANLAYSEPFYGKEFYSSIKH